MMEVVRLLERDYEEATDFLDLVFSKAYAPSDFRKLLPLYYQPNDEKMRCNFAIREAGRIRAIVGSFPSNVQVGDTVLRLGGIGGVSAHPNDRGKGWMKILMTRCLEEMKSEHMDLSFLTGLRQRYQYFGYEKAGMLLQYQISQTNIKRSGMAMDTESSLCFIPLRKNDSTYIEKAKALYDRQEIRMIRPLADFYLTLLSTHGHPWVALRPNGEMIGYLVTDEKRASITEIFAEQETDFGEMIRSWFLQQNIDEAAVFLPPWQVQEARCLSVFAEDYRMINNGNWRIFQWENVISSLLTAKGVLSCLQEGSLNIDIVGYGTLRINVTDGHAVCARTSEHPDLLWDPLHATQIMLGHLPHMFITEIPKHLQPLIESWFPLPLSWLLQNYV